MKTKAITRFAALIAGGTFCGADLFAQAIQAEPVGQLEKRSAMLPKPPLVASQASVNITEPAKGIGVFISSGASLGLDSDRMVPALKFAALDLALEQ